MALVFLSHSSRDDALATGLEAWLRANGFTDLFIDHSSIVGGEAWEASLRASARSCRVVICLVTPNWLASGECPAEFKAAWYMGKKIVPLFLLGDETQLSDAQRSQLARVRAEAQGIGLDPFIAEGSLDFRRDETRAELLRKGLRAAGALAAVGLDPDVFEIDRKARPMPFPGLASFGDDDADAALFFGRSREIAETLEELRAMRAASDRRVMVILGASGAGKSSLLKAGIIPRLRRETPAWLPLRAFRPGADPLLNFAEALTRTLAEFHVVEAHGVLRRTLSDTWKAAERDAACKLTDAGVASLVAVLEAQGTRLRTAANRAEATILISVDQAEEMARAEGDSGEALADYLRAAMAAQSQWRLVFTIRTDSFPELQSHRRFQGLEARGYDLRALPVFRFNDVVEAPARRYGVDIDPALVDALMEDAPRDDALPLLAFAMQRLWDQFAAQRALRAEDYRAMGGLSGLIEDAAERALCGVDPEQRDTALPAGGARKAQAELGARTFVPPLADVNDEGAAIRRVAAWTEFDEEQQDLLDRFGRWRLVVRKGVEAAGGTVEVAHEALFREWTRLREWLEPERARLEALRGLKVASAAWERKGKRAEFLTHFGQRLKDAAGLEKHSRYASQLGADDRAYLAACRKSERAARGRRHLLQGVASTLAVGLVLGSLGFAFQFELQREWMRRTQLAQLTSDQQAALIPGATFRECKTGFACPDMVVVPAGSFDMGSPLDEPGRFDDEDDDPGKEGNRPRIALPHAFAVGKFEVTHEEWAACVQYTRQETFSKQDAKDRVGCAPAGDSGFGGGRRPVINVSWDDAQAYVRWLNQMLTGAGKGPYRLLTEAEWEYAARGGQQAAYPWGDDPEKVCDYANVMNPETKTKYPSFTGDAVDCKNNFVETGPVGSFKPNGFGLFDTAGNVWEWVEDCYRDNLKDQPSDGVAFTKGSCSNRVDRGGSWLNSPQLLRSANRGRDEPSYRYGNVGFRLARTLLEP